MQKAPELIEVKKSARLLRLVFDDAEFEIPLDLLRERSPAADGKMEEPSRGVEVSQIEAVGNYAIRPLFSDGHHTGIYTWEILRKIAQEAAAAAAAGAENA